MSSTLAKSAAAHARAIKELHWKKKPGAPISCEGLTAIYTPKLAALFEQAVVLQKELVIEAVSECAAECNQLKLSLTSSIAELQAHQASF